MMTLERLENVYIAQILQMKLVAKLNLLCATIYIHVNREKVQVSIWQTPLALYKIEAKSLTNKHYQ